MLIGTRCELVSTDSVGEREIWLSKDRHNIRGNQVGQPVAESADVDELLNRVLARFCFRGLCANCRHALAAANNAVDNLRRQKTESLRRDFF